MIVPRAATPVMSLLLNTAFPSSDQVVPPFEEYCIPVSGPLADPKALCLPMPAIIVWLVGSVLSKFMAPMDRDDSRSVRGFQLMPPSVVFQMPPLTAPA